MAKLTGSVYLIHFAQAFGHAKHYVGFAENLPGRISHHRKGTGANLLKHVNAAGIDWDVVQVWENTTRTFERTLKNRGGKSKFCPACKAAKAA